MAKQPRRSQPDTSTVRAAIYTRLSLDRTGDGNAVARQLEHCEALADRLGWTVAVDHRFEDNDTSAMSGVDRPGFEALLDAIKRGEVNAIICWQQDRLYRRISDLSRLLDLPRVRIETVNGGSLDLTNSTGRMLATIIGSVATQESELKSERQRAAARQLAQRGLPKWRNAFGYMPETRSKGDDDGTRQLDPTTALLVAQAYKDLIDLDNPKTISQISREWNKRGALPASGKPWSPSTLSLFLRKPRNAGLRDYLGELVVDDETHETVRGTWPALVDEFTWRRAQSLLNAEGRGPGKKTVSRHLLTGVLLCGKPDCGGYLSGMQTVDSKRITYACKRCRGVSIRAEYVEPIIYGLAGGRLAKPDAVHMLRDDGNDDEQSQQRAADKVLLLGRLDEISDERAEGLIDGKGYKRMFDTITAKLATIERAQQDQQRVKVFDGIPLGTPECVDAVRQLTPDRFRAVVDVLMAPTVLPVGKGGHVFDPNRIIPGWRD